LDFEYLNVFFGKLKFKKMPKFETLSALRGLMDKMVMVSAMDETFRDETYMYEEHFKTNPDLLGVVLTHSPVASLF